MLINIEAPHSASHESFLRATKPLWNRGKRKKPPKLPVEVASGMRMTYAGVNSVSSHL